MRLELTMRINKSIFIGFLYLIICISACTPSYEETIHTVVAIQDGHILQLKDGTYISLIGVDGTPESHRYLEGLLLNSKVNVVFDSHSYPSDISGGQIFEGYVQSLDGLSINAMLLKRKLANLNVVNGPYDSLTVFQGYAEGRTESENGGKSQYPLVGDDSNQDPKSALGSLVERVEKSVFLVSTFDENGTQIALGTGFFVGDNGYAVSNFHVFENGSQWSITTSDQVQYRVEEVVKYSKKYDFVVFKVSGDLSNYPALRIASKRNPHKADDIFVVGNPRGLESTFTRGVVSALRTVNQVGDIIQFDAAISPGSSGSPVMNMRGEVLGVATMKFQECENCNFAMNIHLLDIN